MRAGIIAAARRLPAAGGGLTLLAADSFNRADTSTMLGTSDGPGAIPWTWNNNSKFGVISNCARSLVSGATAGLDVGQVDQKVTVTILNSTNNPGGVALRSAGGSTFWRVIWFTDGKWYISCHAPTVSHRDSFTRARPAVGDTISAQAVTNGANVDITVWHNGTMVRQYTETVGTYTAVTGTYAGIYGDTGAQLDDFKVEAP